MTKRDKGVFIHLSNGNTLKVEQTYEEIVEFIKSEQNIGEFTQKPYLKDTEIKLTVPRECVVAVKEVTQD